MKDRSDSTPKVAKIRAKQRCGAVRGGGAERSAGAQRPKIMLKPRRRAARPCMASGALILAHRGQPRAGLPD